MKARPILELPTQQKLLQHILPEDIYSTYLGAKLTNNLISSPFRRDTTPSFKVFRTDDGGLLFKDFGTGSVGNCFLFVKTLFNLQTYSEVYDKIVSDFNLDHTFAIIGPVHSGRVVPTFGSNKVKDIRDHARAELSVRRRKWAQHDADYWKGKYGLTRAQLEYCGVFPISHFFLGTSTTLADKRSYAYVEMKDGLATYKVYQPYNQVGRKWVSNNDYSTWELWNQLPDNGKYLIITSSRKDSMVIKSCFQPHHVTACSLQAESMTPKPHVVNYLKDRFEQTLVLYDNDFDGEKNEGRVMGAKIAESNGLKQIEIPTLYQTKDISDFREKFGGEQTREVIKKLIKQSNGINDRFLILKQKRKTN